MTKTVRSKNRYKTGRFLWQFALYLSPVLLLMLIFPFVTERISSISVGGVNLTQIVLAASITVPWMSQCVCLPIYKAMEDLLGEKELNSCMKRFCEYWLATCVAMVPVLLVFGLPLFFALNWTWTALLAYLILGFLNMAFGQLLVIANIPTNRTYWAAAWAAYSMALLFFPTVWFLPPVAGIIVQLIVMRKYLRYLTTFRRLPALTLTREAIRGFLMGAVLWADKYFLFAAQGGTMDVIAVYMGLIPAVIAYNYFFAAEAMGLDRSIAKLRGLIEYTSYPLVDRFATRVSKRVHAATHRTLILSLATSVITAVIMYFATPQSFALALVVILTSFFFLTAAIFSYQVDYMGNHVAPQIIGGAHLLLCIMAFSIMPNIGGYYIILGGEILIAIASYLVFRKTWSAPAYDLFWKHAMSW